MRCLFLVSASVLLWHSQAGLSIFKRSRWYSKNNKRRHTKRRRTSRFGKRQGSKDALFDEETVKSGKVLDQFTKIGGGCCAAATADHSRKDVSAYDWFRSSEEVKGKKPAVLFDASMDSMDALDMGLAMCLTKCTEYSDCGTVTYGWKDSDWCKIASSTENCTRQDPTLRKCGRDGYEEGEDLVQADLYLYAPTALTESRAVEACSIQTKDDWLCYLILNSDVKNHCEDKQDRTQCAQTHFIENVLFGTDKRKCRCKDLTETQEAMKTCEYLEPSDWMCYEMLNPGIKGQLEDLKDDARYKKAAQHFIANANPNNYNCACRLLKNEQKLMQRCLYRADSDWDCYRALNVDVDRECITTHDSRSDRIACAMRHYSEYVIPGSEKRPCRCAGIASSLDGSPQKKLLATIKATQKSMDRCNYKTEGEWACYLGLNPDVESALRAKPTCKKSKPALLRCAAVHYNENILAGQEKRPCMCAELANKRCGYMKQSDWRCYMDMNSDVQRLCMRSTASSSYKCAQDEYRRVAIVGGAVRDCQCHARNPCEVREGEVRPPLCNEDLNPGIVVQQPGVL